MKVRWLSFVLLVLWVVLALAAAGCTCGDDDDDNDDDTTPDDDTAPDDDDTTPDDDDDDDDNDTTPSPADELCNEGKALIEAGEGPLAEGKFRAGLELDDENADCHYGLALADTLHQFDTISIVVAYAESFLSGYIPPTRDEPQTGQSFIDEMLNLILNGLLIDASDEAIEQVAWLRENEPDIIYPLEHLPIYLNFAQVADAVGDYDLPDAVAVQAFSGIPAGLAQHLTSLSLDFDLGVVFILVQTNYDDMSVEEIIGFIVDYALLLFDNPLYPDFFTLKDDGDLFKAAGLKTGLGFAHAAETYRRITAEVGDQSRDVLGYDDLNADQTWQENEPLVVPSWGALDEEENAVAWAIEGVCTHLAASFLDYTEYDPDPETAAPFRLSYLNPLLQAFGLPALIPDWDSLVIDFGAAYRDADPTSLRDTLRLILHLLDAFLP